MDEVIDQPRIKRAKHSGILLSTPVLTAPPQTPQYKNARHCIPRAAPLPPANENNLAVPTKKPVSAYT